MRYKVGRDSLLSPSAYVFVDVTSATPALLPTLQSPFPCKSALDRLPEYQERVLTHVILER
jgi:hypothetical protein